MVRMGVHPRQPARLLTGLLLAAVVGGLVCISATTSSISAATVAPAAAGTADSSTASAVHAGGASSTNTAANQGAKDAAYIVEDRGASAILKRLNRLRGEEPTSVEQEPGAGHSAQPPPSPSPPAQPQQPKYGDRSLHARREQWSDSVLIMVLGTVFALILSRCQTQAAGMEEAEAAVMEHVQDAKARLETIRDGVQEDGSDDGYEALLDKAKQVQEALKDIRGITCHPDDGAGQKARQQAKGDALVLLERVLQAALALAVCEGTAAQLENVQALADEAGLVDMSAKITQHLQTMRQREELRTLHRGAEEEQDPQRRRDLLRQVVERARHDDMLHEVGDAMRKLDQLNRAAQRPEMMLLEHGGGGGGGHNALEGRERGAQQTRKRKGMGPQAEHATEHSDNENNDDDHDDDHADGGGDDEAVGEEEEEERGGAAVRGAEPLVEEMVVEEEEDMVVIEQVNNARGNGANALAEADPVLRVQRDMMQEGRNALEVNEVGLRMRQLDDHRMQLFMEMWREQREERRFLAGLRQAAEQHRRTQQQQRDAFQEWMKHRRRELDERLSQERNAVRVNHFGLVKARAQDMRAHHAQALWRSAFLQVCAVTVLYVIASWRHRLHQQRQRAEACPSNPLASTGTASGVLSWAWVSPMGISNLVADVVKFSFCSAYTTLQGWYNVSVACVLLGVNAAVYLLAGKVLALMCVVSSGVLFAGDGVAAMLAVIVYPLAAAAAFDLLWYLAHERLVSRGEERAKQHVRCADITTLAQCLQHMEWHLPRVQGDLYHLLNDVLLPIASIAVAVPVLAYCLPYSVLA